MSIRTETWPEVARRLGRALDELERMLAYLSSRLDAPACGLRPSAGKAGFLPARPFRRKQEREMRTWLRGAIDWIEVVIELGGPESEDEAQDIVLELYHFDLERVAAVDCFHELLEEAGEGLPPA